MRAPSQLASTCEGARRPKPENRLAVAVAALLTTAAWALAHVGRVEVGGDSMRPTLLPGDRLLLLRRGGPWRRVRTGDLVAVPDPRGATSSAHRRVLVKRVAAVTSDGLDIRGDNPRASTDTRTFGTVAPSTVRGRAVYRYHPPERAGRL